MAKNIYINTLSLIVVLLFPFNYLICDLIYDWNEHWDKNLSLRFNIYSIMFLILFILAKNDKTNFSNFILSIGIGFSLSDVVDRCFFDKTVFDWKDILMIVLTLFFSYKNYDRTSRS